MDPGRPRLPGGGWPAWAKQDFWAPDIHAVGTHYVVYFSARGADGMLAIGAASATSPLGPFTPLSQPLIHDASMGLIDASEINAPAGPLVLWKEDGNAVGKPTPIHAQPLAADGLSLVGTPSTLITNDQAWEGAVTEAPFMVASGGNYYLFYSGNSYANATYAVGVARASSPTGPFTKAGGTDPGDGRGLGRPRALRGGRHPRRRHRDDLPRLAARLRQRGRLRTARPGRPGSLERRVAVGAAGAVE